MALVLTLVDLTSMILALGRWRRVRVFFLSLGLPGGRHLGPAFSGRGFDRWGCSAPGLIGRRKRHKSPGRC